MGEQNNLKHPLRIFVNRTDVYAEGYSTGDKAAYKRVTGTVTDELLEKHCRGEITLGMYQLDKNNNVRWGCFDFDENSEEEFNRAKKLFCYLCGENMEPLFEFSGGGQYKCHIWVFCEPTSAAVVKLWMENVCQKLDIHPKDIFPKQITIDDSRPYGNLVKIPLGMHPSTKKRCIIYEPKDDSYHVDADFLRGWDHE